MRILIATGNRNLVGGVEKYLQALIPGLLDRGHEVGLIYENWFDPKQERIDPVAASLPVWCSAEQSLQVVLTSVAKWKPELVYSQGLDTAELEDTLLATYRAVLYAHNYYGTCVTGRKCHTFPQTRTCDRRMGPTCLFLYYPRRCGGLNPSTMWELFRRQLQRNSRLQRYQSIIVASDHMHHEFQHHGVSPDRLHLVPLPAAGSTLMGTSPVNKTPQGRILFLGRLTDLKGTDYLIKAINVAAGKLCRPLSLTIGGDGPERPKLERLARGLGVRAEFSGWLQTSQKIELMREADLLAVPSLWPEPFGMVGVEAGCLGLPSVAYSVGGIQDWLIPGQTGEIAPGDPATVEGLAEAIVRALTDRDHYNRLSLGAWEMARQFTLDGHLAELETVLGAQPALQLA